MTDNLFYTIHASAIGDLELVASNRGMRSIRLLEDRNQRIASGNVTELPGFFQSAIQAIDAYLANGTALHLPVDLAGGTPLQRMVWLEIAKIPYGNTISYTTLADRVGFPRAVRAVASACGANPLPLLIPCHRILAKDGTLGGFSLGGLQVKEQLLALEKSPAAAVA